MAWGELLSFLKARDPAYLCTVQGVPGAEIERCQALCGVSLPRFYVDFLGTMGADPGAFHPFGAKQDCDFYALAEELPPEYYPAQCYFKVAAADDPAAISPPDTFLDLLRSDGQDAPLVRFEDGGGFSGRVIEVGQTLGERLTAGIFQCFEVARHGNAGSLSEYADSVREARRTLSRMLELLATMGFKPVLPAMPRVICLRRGSLSALVELAEGTESVDITFGSDDRRALSMALEQIRERFPGAMIECTP